VDLIVRNARLSDRGGEPLDIGIAQGRIVELSLRPSFLSDDDASQA